MSVIGQKRKQWRCFHCDSVFTSARCAAEHFGRDETKTAACELKAFEGHLLTYIRKLEADLDQYRADDSHVLRSIYTLEADHRQALMRAEEEGYNRGVLDMQKMVPAPSPPESQTVDALRARTINRSP